MKRLLSTLICILAITFSTLGQENYQIDGQEFSLMTAVDGQATLLWNTIDGSYRYFLQKDGEILELKNSRVNGRYQEEYKDVLRSQTPETAGEIDKTKLTLSGLTNYFNNYNRTVDPSFTVEEQDIRLQLRLGPFAGLSNEIFTANPENTLLLVAGADLELVDVVKLRRHSVVLRFRQTFENNEFKYNASQFSLNYRFKFIQTPELSVFVNGKFVAYTYSSRDDLPNPNFPAGEGPEFFSVSGGDLSTPATFGLGVDYSLGNGLLFLTYNDIVGIGVDSNGEFPLDFSLGYKFRL